MRQTIVLKTGIVLGSLLLMYAVVLAPISAHEHENEDTDIDTTSEKVHTPEMERMEQLISLMEQLVLLLSALHIQQGYAPVVPVVTDDSVDMEQHHTEHTTTDVEAATPAAHLVIELETHNGKTHVHVRYTDKPEDMFFVTAPITDEDGIVTAVQTRTGLSAETIRAALKYME